MSHASGCARHDLSMCAPQDKGCHAQPCCLPQLPEAWLRSKLQLCTQAEAEKRFELLNKRLHLCDLLASWSACNTVAPSNCINLAMLALPACMHLDTIRPLMGTGCREGQSVGACCCNFTDAEPVVVLQTDDRLVVKLPSALATLSPEDNKCLTWTVFCPDFNPASVICPIPAAGTTFAVCIALLGLCEHAFAFAVCLLSHQTACGKLLDFVFAALRCAVVHASCHAGCC